LRAASSGIAACGPGIGDKPAMEREQVEIFPPKTQGYPLTFLKPDGSRSAYEENSEWFGPPGSLKALGNGDVVRVAFAAMIGRSTAAWQRQLESPARWSGT
jgi:hypothetical protein